MDVNHMNNQQPAAGEEKPERTADRRSLFRRGLRRTLLLWFLALSMIPVMVVGVISYLNAHALLKQDVELSLKTAVRDQARDIQNYFSAILLDLKRNSARRINYTFLEALEKGFRESHEPLGQYVKGIKWAAMASKYGADLRIHCRDYGYYDIFLMDTAGNILFTVMGEKDLGTNIFHGELSDTPFASACRQALETGKPAFSDFYFYRPSGSVGAGFLVSVMVNDDGDRIGLMGFQLSIDPINQILSKGISLGETGEAYLIGGDLKMRSHSSLHNKTKILGRPVETTMARLWSEEHGKGGELAHEAGMAKGVLTYSGPREKTVLGMYENIRVAGMDFGLIVETEKSEAFAAADRYRNLVAVLMAGMLLLVFFSAARVSNRMVRPIVQLSGLVKRVAGGRFDREIEIKIQNEIGELAHNANRMLQGLREMTAANEMQDWFKTGQARLNDRMREDQDPSTLGRGIITFLAEHLNARIGAMYVVDHNQRLKLLGSYAFGRRKHLSNSFEFGEGLVGQAALEKESITLTNVPKGYMEVSSSLGEAPPRNILVFPFLRENEVKGVIELGTMGEFSARDMNFLDQVSQGIAIAIESARSRGRVQDLLEQTQAQAEELEAQQEQLRQSNE